MKKRSIIYVLIAAMAVTLFASTPIADAAKKPALNKKSASLKVGDKLKLKVRNNKKKVKWSTSKKKVATVTKKGVVKAKAAGKAKITAKIGKTKLTCKVTVTKKESASDNTPAQSGITIANITISSRYQIQVQLSGAQALTAANFTVKNKYYEHGTYNRPIKIQQVTTTDNVNYLIELTDESYISNHSFVQVTVTGLKGTGTQVKEAYCNRGKFTYNETSIIRIKKGEFFSNMIYFDDLYGGNILNSVTGLPAGVKYDPDFNGSYLTIYGTLTQAGTFTATATATGELGSVEKLTIVFIVGAEDAIAAYYNPIDVLVSADGTQTYVNHYDPTPYVEGGFDTYMYSITGESYGMTIDPSTGELEGTIKAPGVYGINITVSDPLNPTLKTTCTATVNVFRGRTVKGVVRDAHGVPVSGNANICFDNKDFGARFCDFTSGYTNENGEYSALVADGTFTAYAFVNGVKSAVKTITVNADMTGVDFVLATNKITFNYEDAALTGYADWTDTNSGRTYESYNNVLYLPDGTYNLTMHKEDGIYTYEAATGSLVVNASSPKNITVKVKKTGELDERLKGTIGIESKNLTLEDDMFVYYTFVPSETKKHIFYSDGTDDVEGCLLDDQGNMLIGDDDSNSNGQFIFSYDCEKGKTYYFGVRAYSIGASTKVTVSDTLL